MKNFEIGAAIVVGLVVGTVQADPVQWTHADGGNGHWYQGFSGIEEISFEEANAHAVSKGGYLVSITSEGEQNFIKNNVADNTDLWVNDVNGCFCGGPFIGGYRNSTEDWQWTDESSWKWTSWHPGNPDGEFEDSQSVRLWDFSSKNWVDHRNAGETGSVVISYIVEWDSLPVQWRIEDGGNGHWYMVEEYGLHDSWSAAQASALAQGGYLATVTSSEENSFVTSLYSSVGDSGSCDSCSSGSAALLGGMQDSKGGWSWVTGESWDFEDWYPGEPNSLDETALYLRCPGQWNDGSDTLDTPCRYAGIVEFTTLPGSALGACCLDGLCITTAAADCSGNSGSWGGPDSSCADFDCPVSCPGDLDGDGIVKVQDLLILIANWGVCP